MPRLLCCVMLYSIGTAILHSSSVSSCVPGGQPFAVFLGSQVLPTHLAFGGLKRKYGLLPVIPYNTISFRTISNILWNVYGRTRLWSKNPGAQTIP